MTIITPWIVCLQNKASYQVFVFRIFYKDSHNIFNVEAKMSHSMHYQGRMITSTQIKYISEQIYDLKNKYWVISTFVVKKIMDKK